MPLNWSMGVLKAAATFKGVLPNAKHCRWYPRLGQRGAFYKGTASNDSKTTTFRGRQKVDFSKRMAMRNANLSGHVWTRVPYIHKKHYQQCDAVHLTRRLLVARCIPKRRANENSSNLRLNQNWHVEGRRNHQRLAIQWIGGRLEPWRDWHFVEHDSHDCDRIHTPFFMMLRLQLPCQCTFYCQPCQYLFRYFAIQNSNNKTLMTTNDPHAFECKTGVCESWPHDSMFELQVVGCCECFGCQQLALCMLLEEYTRPLK